MKEKYIDEAVDELKIELTLEDINPLLRKNLKSEGL